MRWGLIGLLVWLTGCCEMAKRKDMTIIWPAGGLHKALGYQSTPPFTCPAASDVRTVETLEGRRRGGRRPGLTEVYPEVTSHFTSTTPARLLRQITTLSGRRLCAWATFRMFMEDGSAEMQAYVAGTDTTADCTNDYNLECAEYLGQLYIADRGGVAGWVPANGDKASVTANADTLTSAAADKAGTFEELGVRAGQTVSIYDVDGSEPGALWGTREVLSVSGDVITLTATTGLTTTAKFAYIERGPKVWDPEGKDLTALTVTSSDPDVLIGYRLVCRYSNRLFWSGHPDAPYAWICSRAGDPLDYDFSYGLDDVGRATYWQASDQKTIGEPIKALIPHGNDFLLFGCTNSIWILTGDPTFGGTLELVDPHVGVLSETAWCKLPGGATMVLSHDGLYMITGRTAVPVSKGKLPQELIGINPSTYTVSMAYEPRHRGVHIVVTATDTSTHATPTAYWFDLTDGAFWPVTFDADEDLDQSPLRTELQLLDSGSSRVLLASKHGKLYYFDDSAVKDGDKDTGTAVTGTITIGPFRLGEDDWHEGMLTKLAAILDASSGNVTWAVHVASTAEGAIAASAQSTGTWTSGRSMPEYPRARGAAMVIKLSGTSRWAIESILVEIERLGLVRTY